MNAQTIRKSSDLKNILNQHGIYPFVRKAQKTGQFSIQFHDKGLERGTDPAETWVEKIKAVLPGIEIIETTNHRAHWKIGNPVLIATIWADFPEIDLVSHYFLMMQIQYVLQKRFVEWWHKFINYLIFTPKLAAPGQMVLSSTPVTDHIRDYGVTSAREHLHHDHQMHGIITLQHHLETHPPKKYPDWDQLHTGRVITINL